MANHQVWGTPARPFAQDRSPGPVSPGSKVILKVKLAEVFQAKASQDSSFLGMLEKICLLLHLPSGTNMTLHHKGPPHHLTCRT
uniref:surfactant-associated protein 2 isoform X2 n=1 Tax=Myodes glareolus TaxID=447135 RepID=UPI00202278D4|nr:surfactant-associated protein 2 isoform X2 [Myodes glareolus]